MRHAIGCLLILLAMFGAIGTGAFLAYLSFEHFEVQRWDTQDSCIVIDATVPPTEDIWTKL